MWKLELMLYTFKKRDVLFRNKVSARIENLKIPSHLVILMIKYNIRL